MVRTHQKQRVLCASQVGVQTAVSVVAVVAYRAASLLWADMWVARRRGREETARECGQRTNRAVDLSSRVRGASRSLRRAACLSCVCDLILTGPVVNQPSHCTGAGFRKKKRK